VPQVEAKYQQLSRDYNVVNAQYQEVVKRLETARLSGEAEQSENIDFRTIEPARADTAPVASKKLLLIPAIFFGGLAAGGWLALMISRAKSVLYTAHDVAALVRLPVLGMISNSRPKQMNMDKRQAVIRFSAAMLGLLLGLGVSMGLELIKTGLLVTSGV